MLPGAENIVDLISEKTDYVLIDRMNYHYADWVYREHGLEYARTDEFFAKMKNKLLRRFESSGIPCKMLF
jgi:hypothetical protein